MTSYGGIVNELFEDTSIGIITHTIIRIRTASPTSNDTINTAGLPKIDKKPLIFSMPGCGIVGTDGWMSAQWVVLSKHCEG